MFVQPDPNLIFSNSTRRDIEIYLMKSVLALGCMDWSQIVTGLGFRLDGGCIEVKTYTENYTEKVHSKSEQEYIRLNRRSADFVYP